MISNPDIKKIAEEKQKQQQQLQLQQQPPKRIKIRPPISAKRNTKVNIPEEKDLADLMQIKPSQL